MSAVATGLCMALLTSGQGLEVVHVAPEQARVTAAHNDVAREYAPPPHRLRAAAMDANFAEAVEHSSPGSAGRSSAPTRGGGGR